MIGDQEAQPISIRQTANEDKPSIHTDEEESLPLSILDPKADQHEIVHMNCILHGPIELDNNNGFDQDMKVIPSSEALQNQETIDTSESKTLHNYSNINQHEIQISEEEFQTEQLTIGSTELSLESNKKQEVDPQITTKHKEKKKKLQKTNQKC